MWWWIGIAVAAVVLWVAAVIGFLVLNSAIQRDE